MARPGYYILKHLFSNRDLELMDSMGVYKIFHVKKPNSIYIGSTVSGKRREGWRGGFYTRWSKHLDILKKNQHYSARLQDTVNKYGINGIRFQIIEITNKEQAREREKYFINTLNPVYNKFVRSVSKFDMDGNFIKTYENITTAGNETNIDYTSISSNCVGRRPSAGGFLWAYENQKPIIPQKRRVIMYSMDGKFVKQFDTVNHAARELNKKSTNAIRNAIIGNQRHAYGFTWKIENRTLR